MRLHTKQVKAEDVPNDVFIYLEDEERFFFVDDKDLDGSTVTLYFEIGISERGLEDTELYFDYGELLTVVSHYEINDENFWI